MPSKITVSLTPKAFRTEKGLIRWIWHLVTAVDGVETDVTYASKGAAMKIMKPAIEGLRMKHPDATITALIKDQTGAGEKTVTKPSGHMVHEDVPAPEDIGIGPRCKVLPRTQVATDLRNVTLRASRTWADLLGMLKKGQLWVHPGDRKVRLAGKKPGPGFRVPGPEHFQQMQLAIVEKWYGSGALGKFPVVAMIAGVPEKQKPLESAPLVGEAKPPRVSTPKPPAAATTAMTPGAGYSPWWPGDADKVLTKAEFKKQAYDPNFGQPSDDLISDDYEAYKKSGLPYNVWEYCMVFGASSAADRKSWDPDTWVPKKYQKAIHKAMVAMGPSMEARGAAIALGPSGGGQYLTKADWKKLMNALGGTSQTTPKPPTTAAAGKLSYSEFKAKYGKGRTTVEVNKLWVAYRDTGVKPTSTRPPTATKPPAPPKPPKPAGPERMKYFAFRAMYGKGQTKETLKALWDHYVATGEVPTGKRTTPKPSTTSGRATQVTPPAPPRRTTPKPPTHVSHVPPVAPGRVSAPPAGGTTSIRTPSGDTVVIVQQPTVAPAPVAAAPAADPMAALRAMFAEENAKIAAEVAASL